MAQGGPRRECVVCWLPPVAGGYPPVCAGCLQGLLSARASVDHVAAVLGVPIEDRRPERQTVTPIYGKEYGPQFADLAGVFFGVWIDPPTTSRLWRAVIFLGRRDRYLEVNRVHGIEYYERRVTSTTPQGERADSWEEEVATSTRALQLLQLVAVGGPGGRTRGSGPRFEISREDVFEAYYQLQHAEDPHDPRPHDPDKERPSYQEVAERLCRIKRVVISGDTLERRVREDWDRRWPPPGWPEWPEWVYQREVAPPERGL